MSRKHTKQQAWLAPGSRQPAAAPSIDIISEPSTTLQRFCSCTRVAGAHRPAPAIKHRVLPAGTPEYRQGQTSRPTKGFPKLLPCTENPALLGLIAGPAQRNRQTPRLPPATKAFHGPVLPPIMGKPAAPPTSHLTWAIPLPYPSAPAAQPSLHPSTLPGAPPRPDGRLTPASLIGLRIRPPPCEHPPPPLAQRASPHVHSNRAAHASGLMTGSPFRVQRAPLHVLAVGPRTEHDPIPDSLPCLIASLCPDQPQPTERRSMSITDREGHGRAASCWLRRRPPMEPSAGRSCGPGPPCMDHVDKQTASPASLSASALWAPTLRRRSNRAPLRIHRKRREPGPRIPLLAPRMTRADHGSGLGARDEP